MRFFSGAHRSKGVQYAVYSFPSCFVDVQPNLSIANAIPCARHNLVARTERSGVHPEHALCQAVLYILREAVGVVGLTNLVTGVDVK